MKTKTITLAILFISCFSLKVKALSPADYADRFIIDMDAEIPPMEELYEKYAPPSNFDRKFEYYWNIGSNFDSSFAKTIKDYGTRQARIKWKGEEELLSSVKNLPPEFYPYVGPFLHTMPGIPDSVLNMPGIKETKNKFPERIAPEVADIEGLEFMSPAFYFLLMPELWDKDESIEDMEIPTIAPVNRYDAKVMDRIVEIVPPDDFAPGAMPKEPVKSMLRTISPDANSPLTGMDIRAFARSLNDLKEFSGDLQNQASLFQASTLLDLWEEENGNGGILPMIKDLVNPCQRLVQKLKMTGLEQTFEGIVAKEGFDAKEWAYTCDKTIKAYRLLNMTSTEMLTINLFKKNIFKGILDAHDEKIGPGVAITMQSFIEMYKASIEDMLEVKKNQAMVKDALQNLQYRIGSQPVYMK